MNILTFPFSILPPEHLWGGLCNTYQVKKVRIPKRRVTSLTTHAFFHPTYVCVCTYTLPSSPTNDHLWDDPGPKGKNIQRTTYLCIRTHSCVTQFFLYPPSQTPVGRPTSYKVQEVRTHTGLATHSTILNIVHECVTHSFLSIHEHPRGTTSTRSSR